MHLLSPVSLNLPLYEHKKRPSYLRFGVLWAFALLALWNRCLKEYQSPIESISWRITPSKVVLHVIPSNVIEHPHRNCFSIMFDFCQKRLKPEIYFLHVF